MLLKRDSHLLLSSSLHFSVCLSPSPSPFFPAASAPSPTQRQAECRRVKTEKQQINAHCHSCCLFTRRTRARLTLLIASFHCEAAIFLPCLPFLPLLWKIPARTIYTIVPCTFILQKIKSTFAKISVEKWHKNRNVLNALGLGDCRFSWIAHVSLFYQLRILNIWLIGLKPALQHKFQSENEKMA